jgi:DNA polymerase IV
MILHVDMDAFYASIEQRDRPELAGRPVVVGGSSSGRGVVAAASYEARRFGVHSAMPTAAAIRLCPQLIVLPVRMGHYAEVSQRIRAIFHRYTPLVEPLSLDEAFLDVGPSRKLFGDGLQIAHRIKRDILEETRLIASVGVAPNKFLAKIASDLEKPDALVVVDPDGVAQFLAPLPINRLWGVGKVTAAKLQRLGVETIGQLRRLSLDQLRTHFGDHGEHFWHLARGLDDRPVVPDRQAKQISHETTFPQDITDLDLLRQRLWELTEQVARRLRQCRRCGRTVQIKLRLGDFRTITRSRSLQQPTDTTGELWQTAQSLLDQALPATVLAQGLRLIGIGVSGLVDPPLVQTRLFDDERSEQHQQHRQLDKVTDAVQARFGNQAISRANSLSTPAKSKRPADGTGSDAPRPDHS